MSDTAAPVADAPAAAAESSAPAAPQAAPAAPSTAADAATGAASQSAAPSTPAAARSAQDVPEEAATPSPALVPEPELFSIMNIAWFRPADASMYGSRNAARAEVANRTIKALLAAGMKLCLIQYHCLEDLPGMLALWRRIDFRRTQLQGGLPHTTPRGRLPPLSSTGIMVVELPAPMTPGAPYVIPHVVDELHASPALGGEWPVPAKLIWAPPPPEKFKIDEEFTALIGRINCLISFWNGNA